MKKPFPVLLLLSVLCLPLSAQDYLTVMFWNTENLFDTVDDPNKNDNEFTPNGDYRWSQSRYWNKLNAVSKVIVAVDPDNAPALVGLCEVENETVLKDLTERASLRNVGYRYVMTNSPDKRGIDVALLYRNSWFNIIGYESLTVNLKPVGGSPTRDILHVTGRLENHDTIDIYVNHWPSRSGGVEASEPKRICAARVLRHSVDSIFAVRHKPYVIIMGDLNEGPMDPAVVRELGALPYSQGYHSKDRNLITLMDELEGGTYKYDGIWDKYDQFIVSASFLNELGCSSVSNARICRFDFMLTDDDKFGGDKPFRTFNGRRYLEGYSDHLPVSLRLSF